MTVPIPWLIDKEVALDVVQERVDELPDVIVVGLAVKDEMVGGGGDVPPGAADPIVRSSTHMY